MAFSFLSNQAKKRDQIVAIDLGSRNTKAVHIKRSGDLLELAGYALLDAPVYDKNLTPEALGEHLKKTVEALGSRGDGGARGQLRRDGAAAGSTY